jgi:hypothetical protein
VAFVLVASSVGFAFAGPANAQGQVAPSATSRSVEPRYQALIREALTEFDAGNFAEARALFERAHGLHPNARSARGLGVALFELKRYVEALGYLRAALVDTRTPLTDVQRRGVEDLIARATRFVGKIKLDVTPRGASLFLDEQPLTSPELLLDLGTYQVSIRAEGYRDVTIKLVIDGGEDTSRTIALRPMQLSPEHAAAITTTVPDGPAQPVFASTQPEAVGRPVTEQWWFWTGIGVLVVSGAAVALAVALQPEGGREPLYQGSAGSLNGP